MSKKYLEDEDDYQWNDDLKWDERADEFDDSFDDVDDRPRKKKKKSSGKKNSSKNSTVNSSKNSTKKTTKSGAKNSAKTASKSGGKGGTKKNTKKKSSAKKKKRRGMMVALAVLEVLALAVVCVGLYVMSQFNKMTAPSVEKDNPSFRPGKDAEVNDLDQGVLETLEGYYTFAILGLDQRNQDDYSQGQSDVIVLVTVNKDTGEINMASVYRDTYLMVDQSGRYGKINAAYNYGGPHQAVQALNTNLDIQIDYYATVNWRAVAEIIDLVGGVEIEVSEAVFNAKDPYGGSLLNGYIEATAREMDYPVSYPTGPGYQTLNGLQAVAYCRIRQVNLLDYGRAENQRQVLSKVFEKVKDVVKRADFSTLLQIVNTATEYIITDVTPQQAYDMLRDIGSYYLNRSEGFPFATMRTGANMVNSGVSWGDCIIPKDLISNLTELHRILYNNEDYVPSETVLNISAKISADSGVYAN